MLSKWRVLMTQTTLNMIFTNLMNFLTVLLWWKISNYGQKLFFSNEFHNKFGCSVEQIVDVKCDDTHDEWSFRRFKCVCRQIAMFECVCRNLNTYIIWHSVRCRTFLCVLSLLHQHIDTANIDHVLINPIRSLSQIKNQTVRLFNILLLRTNEPIVVWISCVNVWVCEYLQAQRHTAKRATTFQHALLWGQHCQMSSVEILQNI